METGFSHRLTRFWRETLSRSQAGPEQLTCCLSRLQVVLVIMRIATLNKTRIVNYD